MNIIIPIGGLGKRFKSDGYLKPKPLINVLGKPIIFWLLDNLKLNADDNVYIPYYEELSSFNFEDLLVNRYRGKFNLHFVHINYETRGASETVYIALNSIKDNELDLPFLILDSDTFYEDDILNIFRSVNDNLVFYFNDYQSNPIYSYVKIENDKVVAIKEKEKISDNANVGAYGFRSGLLLKQYIENVINSNIRDKEEFYISTVYSLMIKNSINVYAKEVRNFNCLGTPMHLKIFSGNYHKQKDKLRICFDLDNTLVSYPKNGSYNSVHPIQQNINFLKLLYNQGHEIIIYTARRMRTHNGNVSKVIADIGKVTIDKLKEYDIPYHELCFGKPYANMYIDDLAINPYYDLEKETGFYLTEVKPRSFNRIDFSEKSVIKTSDVIDGERYYYNNIPDKLKHLFPKIIKSEDNCIEMEKILGVSYSYLYANCSLTTKDLDYLIGKISLLHEVKTSEDNPNIYLNYSTKLTERFFSYDYSKYRKSKEVYKRLNEYLQNYEENNCGQCGMIHGDPVFSNVMIDNNKNIKFIDMRGKCGKKYTIYGDIFYDYAKMYQSLLGYDFILHERKINNNYVKKMVDYFENAFINVFSKDKLEDLKYITSSLLFSLIPLHDDNKCEYYYNLILREIKI